MQPQGFVGHAVARREAGVLQPRDARGRQQRAGADSGIARIDVAEAGGERPAAPLEAVQRRRIVRPVAEQGDGAEQLAHVVDLDLGAQPVFQQPRAQVLEPRFGDVEKQHAVELDDEEIVQVAPLRA